MVNNALYKSCLFLGAGTVERETQTMELDRLGGLGRTMPVTFGVHVRRRALDCWHPAAERLRVEVARLPGLRGGGSAR